MVCVDIVNTIGSVDDLIEKLLNILDSIKRLRVLIYKRFSFNSTDIVAFKDLVTFENGAQPPKSEHVYEERNGYVRFIQNRDYDSDNHKTYIPISKRNHLCSKYDIMIDKYGDAGAVRYGLEGAYNVALLKVIPNNELTKEYIRDEGVAPPTIRLCELPHIYVLPLFSLRNIPASSLSPAPRTG